MNLIDNIRQKSQKDKIKLIWIVCLTATIILLILWAVTSRIGKDMPQDTSLFQLIKKSVNSLK